MSRKRSPKFLPENVVKAGKGRFRDKSTGKFVPNNWRKRVAARYYGAMNLRGKHGFAVSTLQYKYDLSEDQAKSAYKNWMKSFAEHALGKIDDEPDYDDLMKEF